MHQGGESLAACLESVQAQSHRNWVHLVVDNASTDDTRRIDESYAASDARVTVLSFGELLPMLENFNRALTALPAGARYFKQLNADDTLHPDCLRSMVSARNAIRVWRWWSAASTSAPC